MFCYYIIIIIGATASRTSGQTPPPPSTIINNRLFLYRKCGTGYAPCHLKRKAVLTIMATYEELLSQAQNKNRQRQADWRKSRKQQHQRQFEPSDAAYEDYMASQSMVGRGRKKKKEKPLPDWYVVSLPNDVLYSISRYLWGGEQASVSCVSRDFYKVCGETVVSEFVEHFGSRHPRRMVRTVLFRMVQKSKNITNTNQKGLLLWSAHHGYLKQVKRIISSPNFTKKFLAVRRPSDGATPLFLAAEQNNMEVVRILVGKGAPVNLGTNDNLTPCTQLARKATAESLASAGRQGRLQAHGSQRVHRHDAGCRERPRKDHRCSGKIRMRRECHNAGQGRRWRGNCVASRL